MQLVLLISRASCVLLLTACATPQVIVRSSKTPTLPPLSAEITEPIPGNFQCRMQNFLLSKLPEPTGLLCSETPVSETTTTPSASSTR